MEFRFDVLVQGHGPLDAIEMHAMRLLEGLEDHQAAAGPAIGIDVRSKVLEVTFSASGESLEEATEGARRTLIEVADASGLKSVEVIGFTAEPEVTEQALAS